MIGGMMIAYKNNGVTASVFLSNSALFFTHSSAPWQAMLPSIKS
jgi:hypothetical protein